MLITVIIPVYNAEKFLDRCLKSVINQSYKKFELILVNDGSTDSSEMICRKYILADDRIKVISQENKGPAAARNAGIRRAAGELVFFIDADDYIEKNALEILVDAYRQYQPDLVMANFSKLEINGEIIKQNVTFRLDGELFTDKMKILSKTDMIVWARHCLKHPSNHLISYCWARLYKLSTIKNNGIFAHEDMRLFEDFIFNLDYLKYADKILFVNKPLYVYVMHDNQISVSMAIINADSLLHDMNLLKIKAGKFFEQANPNEISALDIKKEVGHVLIYYVIIFLVRSCRQITRQTKKKIRKEINKIVNSPILRNHLKHYSPSKGHSWSLPLLMKLKLIGLIMFVGKRRAYKRYGKPGAVEYV